MNETWANGTQADEAQGTEAQWAEAEADGTLDDETLADGNEKDGQDVEDLRRVRLRGFLRELVRQEGRMEAAELLGVAYRTLVKAEESGELTGRVSDALERLLSTGDDPEVVGLRERVGALEQRMEGLEDGMGAPQGTLDPLGAAAAGEAAGLAEGQGTAAAAEAGGEDRAQARGEAGRSETGAAPPVAGLRSAKRETEWRLDPEVVTEQPADDDPEVYGDAWALVEEWRGLRAGHPHQGNSLSWLVTEERLLGLELAMLEEHGLTLPPETEPLRGFGRRGQTSWRWTALYDTRVALRKRKLLRWVRRICTLGLWWK